MPAETFGYHACYLRVDLTSRTSQRVSLSREVLRQYIGGSGLGTWILQRETNGQPDALTPESPLVFVFSPLVGSPITTSAKFAVLAKSPLTHRLNDSLSSSHFAIAGKKTGYDAIVIIGQLDEPGCLLIEPERIRFEPAKNEWGLSSAIATAQLRERFGREFRFSGIGPAGENRVPFATLSNDGRHAGRGGLGAVMGAKNLKAVGVRGDRRVEYADAEKLVEYSRELSKKSFGPATEKYRELGTVSNLLTFNRLGTLPTRNFQQGRFEDAVQLAPETMATHHPRTRSSCAACTIGCEHLFQLEDKSKSVRLEYENLFALGPLCGISDPDIVLQASGLCDELGLDTISTGATIAFAMECAERGLIDFPKLHFGNSELLLQLIQDIGHQRGWGELLGQGTRAVAKQIGHGADAFAPHVKGLEIPGYEPRALQGMALGFAVGTRGADHNRSSAYQVDFTEGENRFELSTAKLQLMIQAENEAALMDSLILCKFLRRVFDDKQQSMAEMLRLITGWDITAAELTTTANRIITAKKWYNITQGWMPGEDTLPARFFEDALPEEENISARLDEKSFHQQRQTYNELRNWSPEGWISPELLGQLNIPHLISDST